MFSNFRLIERLSTRGWISSCLIESNNCVQNSSTYIKQLARFQTTLTSEEKKLNNEKKTKSNKTLNNAEKYFSKTKDYHFIKNHFPPRFFRIKKSTPDSIYLANKQIAKEIVSLIKDDLKRHDSHIIEANPGAGILTKELLNIGLTNIRLFESSDGFMEGLQKIQNKNPSIILKKMDLFQLWKIVYQDKVTQGNRLQELLNGITPKNWSDDPVMKIIGFLPSNRFINHLIMEHAFNSGLTSFGRSELYFIMTSDLFKLLTSSPDDGYLLYRSVSILFQMLYNYELIAKLPRKDFLPWQKIVINSRTKLKKLKLSNDDLVYFMKCTPKKDFFDQFENPQMVLPLVYFIKHHFRSRSARVIPKLENWIPGCGTRLIHEGYSIYTEFGELHIEEIMKLFKSFYNWPEYRFSSFIPSMETNYYLKEEVATEIENLDYDIRNDEYIDEDESEEIL